MRVQEVQLAIYPGDAMFQPTPEVCHQPENILSCWHTDTGSDGSTLNMDVPGHQVTEPSGSREHSLKLLVLRQEECLCSGAVVWAHN